MEGCLLHPAQLLVFRAVDKVVFKSEEFCEKQIFLFSIAEVFHEKIKSSS